jgi:hypothetical protein
MLEINQLRAAFRRREKQRGKMYFSEFDCLNLDPPTFHFGGQVLGGFM